MSASTIFIMKFLKKAFVLLILLLIVSLFIWIDVRSTCKSAEILKTSYFLYMDSYSDIKYSIDKNLINERDQEKIIFFGMSTDVLNSSPGVPVAYFNGKGFMRRRGIVTASGSVQMKVEWEERFMVMGLGFLRNEFDAPAVSYEIIAFHDLIRKQ